MINVSYISKFVFVNISFILSNLQEKQKCPFASVFFDYVVLFKNSKFLDRHTAMINSGVRKLYT